MKEKDHEYNKKVGKRVRSARMMNDLTQENLGDMLGISAQAVQKIESGRNSLTVSSLIIICDELNVTPEYILHGTKKTERDFEVSFETMTGEQKIHLLFRLILYISKVDNEKYKRILEDIIDTLEREI